MFDCEKDAWFDLDLYRARTASGFSLKKRDFVRHGDVSNWLTSEAFDLKEPRSLEAEEAITKALSLVKTPAPSKKQIDEVDRLLRKCAGRCRSVLGALVGIPKEPRDSKMIRVNPAPEPPTFDELVRTPGSAGNR